MEASIAFGRRVDGRARRAVRELTGGAIGAGAPRPRLMLLRIRVLALCARDRWRWRRAVPMRDAATAVHIPILPASSGVSLAPRHILGDRIERAGPDLRLEFPPVRAHVLRDAWLDPQSSSVVVGSEHLLSDWAFDRLHDGRIKGAGVLVHDGDRVLHRFPRRPRVIDRGVQLTGSHSHNWYHWVAEILPKASLLEHLPHAARDWPLLVPEAVTRHSTYREVLDTLLPGREVIVVPGEAVLVRELAVLDGLVLHTPGFAPGALPRHDTELIHVDALRRFRSRLLSGLDVAPRIEPGLRLFIDRHHDAQRTYNREELLGIATEYGFRPVVGGDLTLKDQAEIFARAELVIGPNGAGWTDILFAASGCRGLCWLVEDGFGGPWFRNLGLVAGAEIRYLEAEPRGLGNPLTIDYWVDPIRFRRALSTLVAGW